MGATGAVGQYVDLTNRLRREGQAKQDARLGQVNSAVQSGMQFAGREAQRAKLEAWLDQNGIDRSVINGGPEAVQKAIKEKDAQRRMTQMLALVNPDETRMAQGGVSDAAGFFGGPQAQAPDAAQATPALPNFNDPAAPVSPPRFGADLGPAPGPSVGGISLPSQPRTPAPGAMPSMPSMPNGTGSAPPMQTSPSAFPSRMDLLRRAAQMRQLEPGALEGALGLLPPEPKPGREDHPSEIDLRTAQADESRARAHSLRNPQPKAGRAPSRLDEPIEEEDAKEMGVAWREGMTWRQATAKAGHRAPAERPIDDGDPYTTDLRPSDVPGYESWKAENAPEDSGLDYDLRGAFKAGVKPGPDGHWPDTFKMPNHPTFSSESKYAAAKPELAGHWEGEKFVPPARRQAKAAPKTVEEEAAREYALTKARNKANAEDKPASAKATDVLKSLRQRISDVQDAAKFDKFVKEMGSGLGVDDDAWLGFVKSMADKYPAATADRGAASGLGDVPPPQDAGGDEPTQEDIDFERGRGNRWDPATRSFVPDTGAPPK